MPGKGARESNATKRPRTRKARGKAQVRAGRSGVSTLLETLMSGKEEGGLVYIASEGAVCILQGEQARGEMYIGIYWYSAGTTISNMAQVRGHQRI